MVKWVYIPQIQYTRQCRIQSVVNYIHRNMVQRKASQENNNNQNQTNRQRNQDKHKLNRTADAEEEAQRPGIACSRVHSLAVNSNSGLSFSKTLAIVPRSGLLGFGLSIRLQIPTMTLLMLKAGDHLPSRVSKQTLPASPMLG